MEIVKPKIMHGLKNKINNLDDFLFNLVRSYEQMRVILSKSSDT